MISRTPLLLALTAGLALPVLRSAPAAPSPDFPAHTRVDAVESPFAPATSTRSMVVGNQTARVIVKLRQHDRQISQSSTGLGTGLSAMRPENSAALAALVEKHAVRSAVPLCPEHVRGTIAQSGSGAGGAATLRQRYPIRAARAEPGTIPPDFSRTYVLELGPRSPADVEALLASLRSDPGIVYAEQDGVVHTCYVPNDPSFSSSGSWGQSYDDLHGLKAIGATAAWDTTQGAGAVVAVIDTGVDYDHPDITDNIWTNDDEVAGNGLDDDGNGFVDDVIGWDFAGASIFDKTEDADPMDRQGHGSHVAGTVAAIGDNNEGVVGVAWKARIMAVKGLDDSGSGEHSSLARCIIYAVDNGADVINASWGGESSSETLTDAVNYAHAHGVVFIAAAGNSAADAAGFSPANIPAAITVAALDPNGNSAYFSNFGSRIDVAAPGVDILSLEAQTAGYTRKDGTSMAAPHVSGLAALILAGHPTFAVEQVRQALRTAATDLGAEGKDPKFGYGRINAAAAVLVDRPLVARILSPENNTAIAGSIAIVGSAGGDGLSRYVVEFASANDPHTWTTLRESSVGVTQGELAVFEPFTIQDGRYTLRLRSISDSGAEFSDEIDLEVRYLQLLWPGIAQVPSTAQLFKPGESYAIRGSARGPSFRDFRIEWAPGLGTVSEWTTDGINLVGEGLEAVTDGVLATWSPPSTLEGFATFRLTVSNAGFSSSLTTLTYAEPSLLTSGWPVPTKPFRYEEPLTLVRLPDGSTHMAYCNRDGTVHSFAFDGSSESTSLEFWGGTEPVAADLDGLPGDELVVPDFFTLKVFSSRLDLIRAIPTNGQHFFSNDRIMLADLDNDGTPEIIAPTRSPDWVGLEECTLYIFRADGERLSELAPPQYSIEPLQRVHLAAADLEGDHWKEIVLAYHTKDAPGYDLRVLHADGSPASALPSMHMDDLQLRSLSTADLDGDGSTELILAEYDPSVGAIQVRVLDRTGATRPGWPVRAPGYEHGSGLAIADLDSDGRSEVLFAISTMIMILRDDGSPWCPSLTFERPSPGPSMSPLVADIDGDGSPELVVLRLLSNEDGSDTPSYYNHMELTCLRLDGTILRRWPIFGVPGQQPFIGTPLVCDFNGDGLTDIAVNTPLIAGGGNSGWLIDYTLTCLTTGTPFNPRASPWVSDFADSQNSRTPNVPPGLLVRPQTQTARAGEALHLDAAISGHPRPRIQWQKDGIDIPGATGTTLAFPSVQRWNAGRYTLVVTSRLGSVACDAVLTVDDVTTATSRALNLSTRAFMRDGANQPLIPGFVIEGTGTKRLLIRAVGPTLSELGVGDFVPDPSLVLKRFDPVSESYVDVGENDDWSGTASLNTVTTLVGAFPLAPDSRDAAMLFDAGPGQYTVFANASGEQTAGIALVEIYDADDSGSPANLINVSNRGHVGVGGSIMIPGFVIANEGPRKFLIRAVGPGLVEHGVTGVLSNPQLLLFRMIPGTETSELILGNDDWSDHPDAENTAAVAELVGAFALAPGSNDAAFVATLEPGAYTIHASGVDDTTGEALVELYLLR